MRDTDVWVRQRGPDTLFTRQGAQEGLEGERLRCAEGGCELLQHAAHGTVLVRRARGAGERDGFGHLPLVAEGYFVPRAQAKPAAGLHPQFLLRRIGEGVPTRVDGGLEEGHGVEGLDDLRPGGRHGGTEHASHFDEQDARADNRQQDPERESERERTPGRGDIAAAQAALERRQVLMQVFLHVRGQLFVERVLHHVVHHPFRVGMLVHYALSPLKWGTKGARICLRRSRPRATCLRAVASPQPSTPAMRL